MNWVKDLIADQRGGARDVIILVAIVLGIATGALAFYGRSIQETLDCQGQTLVSGNARCREAAPPLQASAEPTHPMCDGITCLCFVAGTPVLTSIGPLPIEAIVPGMMVLSRDEHGTDVGWRRVDDAIVTQASKLMRLSLRGPSGAREDVFVTPAHPFFVPERGWVDAAALRPGQDSLIDSDAEPVAVLELQDLNNVNERVYNLSVADYHTYFAGRLGVWAHNLPVTGMGCSGGGSLGSASVGMGTDGVVMSSSASGSGAPGGSGPPGGGPGGPGGSPAPGPHVPMQPEGLTFFPPGTYRTSNGGLLAQEHRPGTQTYQFPDGTVNEQRLPDSAGTVVASPSGYIAVEAADDGRQAKIVFLEPTLVGAINDQLLLQGSDFGLASVGETITLNPGHPDEVTLTGVQAINLPSGGVGCNATIAGSCDQSVKEVTGSFLTPLPTFNQPIDLNLPAKDTVFHEQYIPYYLAEQLVPGSMPDPLNLSNPKKQFHDATATYWGQAALPDAALDQRFQDLGINQYALPNVGQAVATYRLGDDTQNTGTFGFGEHWAGAVAVDGDVYVTLENFVRPAEGDWSGSSDRRHFFGVYSLGENSFHSMWGGTSPVITMVHDPAPAPVPYMAWDKFRRQGKLRFGDGTNPPNAAQGLPTANTAQEEGLIMLQGVAYAQHVIQNSPRPGAPASSSRPPDSAAALAGWQAAASSGPQFPENQALHDALTADLNTAAAPLRPPRRPNRFGSLVDRLRPNRTSGSGATPRPPTVTESAPSSSTARTDTVIRRMTNRFRNRRPSATASSSTPAPAPRSTSPTTNRRRPGGPTIRVFE